MQEIISQISKEIKKDLLPKYPFIKRYKIENFDEKKAEDYAYNYYNFGKILKI